MAFDAERFVATLPEEPGVYRMLSDKGDVLYVGKAKHLRRRVASYFRKSGLSPRIQLMVAQIGGIETTVVRSEGEALLLENNLIKELAPRYNILFRDDKSYPYILFTRDEFPRLAFYRGRQDARNTYFGPFPSSVAVRESIALLQRVFKLRTCEDTVFRNRSRPCLLHQIKRCKAPCVGLVTAQEYGRDARQALLFLRGRHTEVIDQITADMQAAAAALAYEQAAALRDQIRMLHQVLQKHYAESSATGDTDILSAVEQGGTVCVNLAMVRGGRHLGDRAYFPAGLAGITPTEVLAAFVGQHYADHPIPPRIVVAEQLGEESAEGLADLAGQAVVVALPRSQEERVWLAMAEKNARLAATARLQREGADSERLEALCRLFGLDEPEPRIECFDISHTMGEATVASCVVFDKGRMEKSEYRRFNIAVTPGDDYAAMRDVLTRRYQRVAAGDGVSPAAVLIDGGKGQVGVAREVMNELALDRILIVGVAKGEERKAGLEQLIFADGTPPKRLNPDDPALHLIQQIRDEAHRFAITGHRARRAKARLRSSLEGIPGVGAQRRKRLLGYFGGLQGVMAASVEELARVDGIGRGLAEIIHQELH